MNWMEEGLVSASIRSRLPKTKRKSHIVIFNKAPEYRYLVENKLKGCRETIASQHLKKKKIFHLLMGL